MSDIVIKNLVCGYADKKIFDGFDITFDENEINVVLGGSGVGKTTLLNAIASLKEYDGRIEGIDGGVSYIFQKDRLIPTISVYKNLDLVLRAVYKDKSVRKKAIEDMAKLVEIEDVLQNRANEISGGQAQRAAMARAFLYPGKVLLLDEPFKALDVALKSRLISMLLRLNDVERRTVIFVTHSVDECLLCADRYFVLGGSPVSVVCEGGIDIPQSERELQDNRLERERCKLLDTLTEKNSDQNNAN